MKWETAKAAMDKLEADGWRLVPSIGAVNTPIYQLSFGGFADGRPGLLYTNDVDPCCREVFYLNSSTISELPGPVEVPNPNRKALKAGRNTD